LFSDKSIFTSDGRHIQHNCHYWAAKNPLVQRNSISMVY